MVKSSMTPRERVEIVMNLGIPDRVPIGDGLFQHWAFINHHYATEKNGKWTLEEICKGVGIAGVDYAFDIAPSLTPHREKRLGLTYQVTEWTEVVVDRPFKTLEEAKLWVKNMIIKVKSSNPESMWSFAGNAGIWGLGRGDYREEFLWKQNWLGDFVLMHTGSPAQLDTCYMMLGLELFSYLLADDPGLLKKWFDGLIQQEIERVHL